MSTKEKIIETVIDLLKQNVKYEEISMTLIAEKVGIGKSTIYDYFKTKSEMLMIAVHQYINLLVDDLFNFDINKYNFHDSLIKQLQLFMHNNISPDFALTFIYDNKDLFTEGLPLVEGYLQNLQKLITNRFEEIFRKGIEEKIIKINDDKNIFYVLNSIIFGAIAIQCKLKHENKGEIEIFESVYDSIVKILN